jgi:hypothetical protein
MEPDHANITQITGWLHSAERWSELAELAQCQIFNQMAAADWEPYVMTCLEEMGRDDPHYAGWANLMLSMLVVGVDVDQAIALIDRFVELASRLDDDHKRLWEMSCRTTASGLLGQAVSEAEGDVDHARTLITSTISPRSPGTHLAMYLLAARLGIGDEVHELRRAERADGSSQNRDLPKQTLRAELLRRNWLD